MILVAVACRAPDRIAEALRAAVGLGLRGEAVEVWLDPAVDAASDPRVTRARAMLAELAVPVHHGDLAPVLARARAVEHWS